MNDFDFFEGTRIIQNEDGSTTYYHVTHEPYVEPLTTKQKVAVTGALTAVILAPVAPVLVAVGVEKFIDWKERRQQKRMFEQ